jgi:acyl-CoA thioesterase FadM
MRRELFLTGLLSDACVAAASRALSREEGDTRRKSVQALWRGTEELVRIEVRVACLRGDGRPTRIPAPLRQAFEPYLQPREQG